MSFSLDRCYFTWLKYLYEDRTSLSNIQQFFFLLKLRKYFSYQFIETMVLYANWFCKIFKLLLSSNLDNSSYHTSGSMPRCMHISSNMYRHTIYFIGSLIFYQIALLYISIYLAEIASMSYSDGNALYFARPTLKRNWFLISCITTFAFYISII